jgi:hypothetical protein
MASDVLVVGVERGSLFAVTVLCAYTTTRMLLSISVPHHLPSIATQVGCLPIMFQRLYCHVYGYIYTSMLQTKQ